MREILLSLDQEKLPVQYGVTAGSLVERFFIHVVEILMTTASTSPVVQSDQGYMDFASGRPVDSFDMETEDGILFRYHPAAIAKDAEESTQWVAETSQNSAETDWLEVSQGKGENEQRAAVLRMRTAGASDVFFVAASSEMFMTTVLFSQTPGCA